MEKIAGCRDIGLLVETYRTLQAKMAILINTEL